MIPVECLETHLVDWMHVILEWILLNALDCGFVSERIAVCWAILMKSHLTYKWTLKFALTLKCPPWKSLSKWDKVASMKLRNDLRLKVDYRGFVTLPYVLYSHTGIVANFWTSERIRVLWICGWGSNMKSGGQWSLIHSLGGRCWWKAFLTD